MFKWRVFFLIYLLLIIWFASNPQAFADNKKSSPMRNTTENPKMETREHLCRYHSGDVGQIIGRGKDANEAREKASEICFDRRLTLYEKSRGHLPGEEQSDALIDSCVNISCG